MNARRTAADAGTWLAAAVLLCGATAQAAPRWVRLAMTGPADTTATVMWTDDAPGAGWVEYRLRGGSPLTLAATGTDTGFADLDATYVARIEGLTPGTEYEYRVTSNGNFSTWATFRTAPRAGSCDPVRFVAVGDSRGQTVPLAGYEPSLQWPEVAREMAMENPHFVLHDGDFVHKGHLVEQWPEEMAILEPLSRRAPFMLVLGNHDVGPEEGRAAFNALFDYPADGPDRVDDYYSFVAGNVLVVGLSTYTFSMERQIDWMRSVLLQHLDDVDWRVVFLHTPVWSSGYQGNNHENAARADVLVPVLDSLGVDLVLAGHDHQYERFHPSRGGFGMLERVIRPLPEDNGRMGVAEGPLHFVLGGGGSIIPPAPLVMRDGSAVYSTRLHYMVADASRNTLTLTIRDCGNQVSLAGPNCSGDIEVIRLRKPEALCRDDAPDAGAPADAGDGDAGLPQPDGGFVADAGDSDGGVGAPDAGAETPDGGSTTAVPGGCGCGVSPMLAPALLAGLFLLVRPRRRR